VSTFDRQMLFVRGWGGKVREVRGGEGETNLA
jgi:hypothetical protein